MAETPGARQGNHMQTKVVWRILTGLSSLRLRLLSVNKPVFGFSSLSLFLLLFIRALTHTSVELIHGMAYRTL